MLERYAANKRGFTLPTMIKIISCNIAHREDAWRSVFASDADIALLQEATRPPTDIADNIKVDSAPWHTTRNVPTYYSVKQTPATATRQLDFLFASDGLAEQVHTRALNDPDSWGPSDHCCVEIEIV